MLCFLILWEATTPFSLIGPCVGPGSQVNDSCVQVKAQTTSRIVHWGDCMSGGGVQVGPCRGKVALPGLGLQWHVLRLNHGPRSLAPHGRHSAMAFRLLCLWLHWDLLVPGVGEECLQLACCG